LACCCIVYVNGCTDRAKIAELEKKNHELQAQLDKERSRATDFDLQSKCSKAANVWFAANYSSDKDTILLAPQNHYNRSLNRCFVFIEWHYHVPYQGRGSWMNHMTIYDVNENVRYGSVAEMHLVDPKTFDVTKNVSTCEVGSKSCKSLEEFNSMIASYLSD
jgi:hypothetical protein